MNPELKAKWVEALRSGEYKQGSNRLLTADGRYCCMGVLCNLIDPEGWTETLSHKTESGISYSQGMGFESVLKISDIPAGVTMTLANMNDKGKSFPEIASYIEANLRASPKSAGSTRVSLSWQSRARTPRVKPVPLSPTDGNRDGRTFFLIAAGMLAVVVWVLWRVVQ